MNQEPIKSTATAAPTIFHPTSTQLNDAGKSDVHLVDRETPYENLGELEKIDSHLLDRVNQPCPPHFQLGHNQYIDQHFINK